MLAESYSAWGTGVEVDFNSLGEEGWELVVVVMNEATEHHILHTAYFKRPKEDNGKAAALEEEQDKEDQDQSEDKGESPLRSIGRHVSPGPSDRD